MGSLGTLVGHIVPLGLHATPSNTMHHLRYAVAAKWVGPAMAVQLSKMCLAETSEVYAMNLPEKAMRLQIKQDLVCALGSDLKGLM